MGLGVQAHSFCAEFRLDGFRFAEFVRGVFVKYVDHALARGNEDQPSFGLIGRGIDAGGDRE